MCRSYHYHHQVLTELFKLDAESTLNLIDSVGVIVISPVTITVYGPSHLEKIIHLLLFNSNLYLKIMSNRNLHKNVVE